MNRTAWSRAVLAAVVSGGIAALSACTTPTPPPPPAPAPVVVIPPQPMPPMGAPETLNIPDEFVNGQRVTVNSMLSGEQAVWNLRSAYNVAALNCVDPKYALILANYKVFLKARDKELDTANAQLDTDFRNNFGSRGVRERETYNTSVYNYFALPPVSTTFCDTALEVSNEINALPVGGLAGYAPQGVAKMEAPFRSFFDSYDQYKADLAAWRARYGGIVVIAPKDATLQRPTEAPAQMSRPSMGPVDGQPAATAPAASTASVVAAARSSAPVTAPVPAPVPAPVTAKPATTFVSAPVVEGARPAEQGSIVLPGVAAATPAPSTAETPAIVLPATP